MKVIGVVIVYLIIKEFYVSVMKDPESYLILEAHIVELTMVG